MCGRYSLGNPDEELLETLFGLPNVPDLPPRFNIAPTDTVPVVRTVRDTVDQRELAFMRWGLIPFWSKALPKVRWINARVETAATRSPYKQCFEKRRCLVPADGFYEWRKVGKQKVPFHIRFADRRTFFMAGLWGWWKSPEGQIVDSCTVLTRPSSGPISGLHDRQPILLSEDRHGDWLDPQLREVQVLEALLDDPLSEAMELVELLPLVNSVRNEGPELWTEAPVT